MTKSMSGSHNLGQLLPVGAYLARQKRKGRKRRLRSCRLSISYPACAIVAIVQEARYEPDA